MELHVRVVSARNLLDKQTFGRQDPYCKVSVRTKTFKTRVHDNGHLTPVWNEKFVFEVYDPQLEQLHVQIKDKNFTASVLIGEVRLPVNMFLHGNVTDQWYTVNNGSKRAGEINLRVQLLGGPNGGGAAATKPTKMAQGYAAPVAAAPAAYNYNTTTSAPPPQAYPAYHQPPPPQQQYAPPPQQQYAPPPQQQYAPPPQQQYAPLPQQQYAPPPPPQYYAPPPPPQHYAQPPPPMVITAPPPVVMAPPPQVVYTPGVAYAAPGYYPGRHHHHHDGDGGYYGRGGGVSGSQVALGVGAGVVGGLLLGEVLDDIF